MEAVGAEEAVGAAQRRDVAREHGSEEKCGWAAWKLFVANCQVPHAAEAAPTAPSPLCKFSFHRGPRRPHSLKNEVAGDCQSERRRRQDNNRG